MKHLAIFILLLVCLYCEANNNMVCEVYDAKTKTLEKHCGSLLPPECSTTSLDASTVENLMFRNCDSAVVLNTTKLHSNIHTLDISNSNYSTIDWLNIQLPNLKVFDASDNQIEGITNLLQNAPHVTEIDLSYNALQTITIDSFGTLNELIDINLSNNMLAHINSDGFTKISTNLEHIDLSNNDLVGIPELPTCYKLRILHLEKNIIKNFTCQRIPWHDSLSAIHLSWIYVERFDGSPVHCKPFRVNCNGNDEGIVRTVNGSVVTYELQCNQKSFENIQSFHAGRNVFTNVDALIEEFDSKLQELDLSGCTIDKLNPRDFKRFTNLRKLSLSETNLRTFDFDMISGAHSLESLDISKNRLNQLHNAKCSLEDENRILKKLKELNLSGNQLTHDTIVDISKCFSPAVEVLDLSDNDVGKLYIGLLEELFKTGPSMLKTLNLRNANISIDNGLNPLENLPQLHTLDISHNNLSQVDFGTLTETLNKLYNFEAANCELNDPLNILQYFGRSLKKINLSGNRIGGGHINVFDFQSTNLIHLNLSSTELKEFDLKVMINQEWLFTLDISHNQLYSIDLHELRHFVHLKRLYLNDNELKQLDRFKPNVSPNVSLALARNRLPCMYLKQLKYDSPDLKYIGDTLDQKHGENCRSSAQAIGDFLDSVYDTVKFW